MALQVLTIQEAVDAVPSEKKDAQAEKCLVQLATLHTVRKKKGRPARGEGSRLRAPSSLLGGPFSEEIYWALWLISLSSLEVECHERQWRSDLSLISALCTQAAVGQGGRLNSWKPEDFGLSGSSVQT